MPTTRPRSSAALLAALVLAAAPAFSQVFKWTDDQGRTHYGDKAPEDAKTQEIKVQATSYDGPPQIQDWAAILRRAPKGESLQPRVSGGLTMFSATWCGPCKRAKAYMAEKGISYRDVDIDASAANAKEFKSFGGGGVPYFIAGEKSMRGFRPEALDRLVAGR